MWTRERLRTTGNPASGQSRTWTRERRIASPMLWPLGLRGDGGGGGALFWSLPYLFPWKGLFLSQGSRGNGKLRRVDFFFFQGGGGVGSRRYVCMYAVAGEPSKEGVCYRAWEWSVWECTPVLYSKVYFLTKVLHSCSHYKKWNSNTDDNQYLDEYSKPTIIWKCWLDNL